MMIIRIDFWRSFSMLWGFNLGGVGDGGYIWVVVVSIFWVLVGGGV